MSEPFLAQLMLCSWNFPPKGFAPCNGQLLPINQNQALFSLLGTTFGGNGQTNFALPNLQGRTPVSFGNGIVLGEIGGQDAHTLIISEVPAHSHQLQATTTTGAANKPGNNMLANTTGNLTIYTATANLVAMNAASITNAGQSQPHENRQPFLTMNWVIALQGIFPSPN